VRFAEVKKRSYKACEAFLVAVAASLPRKYSMLVGCVGYNDVSWKSCKKYTSSMCEALHDFASVTQLTVDSGDNNKGLSPQSKLACQ